MTRKDFEKLKPEWEQWNREDHFTKHGAEVATVLGLDPTVFGKWEYDSASKATVAKSKVMFEAEHWERHQYAEPRRYFLDGRLLQAITDRQVQSFVSYYPETFDGTVSLPALVTMTEGDRLLKLRTTLENRERGRIYRNIRRHHGFNAHIS